MTDIKHKYGPFKKNEDSFYRVCLKCGKKMQYPFNEDIDNEYNNQRITDYIIDIFLKKDITLIQSGNYFFKLVACLMDNISYIFLNDIIQEKLMVSLRELNNYFNNEDDIRYNLINSFIVYLKSFFDNYNGEVNDIYNDDLCEYLDDKYIDLCNNIDMELDSILFSEDNTVVEINSDFNEDSDEEKIGLSEAENESE